MTEEDDGEENEQQEMEYKNGRNRAFGQNRRQNDFDNRRGNLHHQVGNLKY